MKHPTIRWDGHLTAPWNFDYVGYIEAMIWAAYEEILGELREESDAYWEAAWANTNLTGLQAILDD